MRAGCRPGRAVRRCCLAVLLLPLSVMAGSGGWTGTMKGLRVGGPGRAYASRAFTPPALATGARIQRVRWRYALPPGRVLVAVLCAGRRCTRLDGRRGTSRALAGAAADVPLRFHFSLPPGEVRPVRVERLRLSVEYRRRDR